MDDYLSFNARNALARNFAAARMARGLSQDEAAKLADVSRATIIQIESACGDPQLSTVEKLAKVAAVSPAFLLMNSDDIEAIANLADSEVVKSVHLEAELHGLQEKVSHYEQVGTVKSRRETVATTIAIAGAAGLASRAIPFAAIGTAIIPGLGTAIAAGLGAWLIAKKDTKSN